MTADRRAALSKAKRWVVKIGSALLTDEGRGLDKTAIADWVGQLAVLRKAGIELVLVSSGSVAEGMTRLGLKKRPTALHQLQAAAAVGQMGLVQTYESAFQQHGLHTAQILLVHEDVSDRRRYLNARSTLQALLDLGVIPVVNENDTVATEEIRFGDNDTLAGLVANLIDADVLLILTDRPGMYEADPTINPHAALITEAPAQDPSLREKAGESAGQLGRGGMITKVKAAQLAARSGAHTVIAGGKEPRVIERVVAGECLGTLLYAAQKPVTARKQWLAGQLQTRGVLHLDDGAVRVLRESGRSLLSVGVKRVEGQFGRGELVRCVDSRGQEVARGLVNYSAAEAAQIAGVSSDKIADILCYEGEQELIHRDNMVLS